MSPIQRNGSPAAGAPESQRQLAVNMRATPSWPEAAPHHLCMLAAEMGGRFNDDSQLGVTPCRSAGALRLRCAERPRKAGRGGGGENLGNRNPAPDVQHCPGCLDDARAAKRRRGAAHSEGATARSRSVAQQAAAAIKVGGN